MDKRSVTCCFTGHRPNKLPWGTDESDPRCLRLKEELAARLEGVYEAGFRHFICGMALGCDLYFAEAVLALRAEHPEITLEAAIPCEGQSAHWTAAQRKRYDRLVAECDYCTVIAREYSREMKTKISSALASRMRSVPGRSSVISSLMRWSSVASGSIVSGWI